jgi:drug/metabolite transporter (DMT)-like permease
MWGIYSIIGSLSAAGISILQKHTLKDLHAVQLMTVTGLILGFFSLFLIPFFGTGVQINGYLPIIAHGVTVAFAAILTSRALRHLDISIVAPFFNLGTVFTAILAFILFNERVSIIGLIGIALLIIGGYILELRSKNLLQPIKDIVHSDSTHYLLGGVFLYSLSFIIAKYALDYVNPIGLFAYQQIIGSVIFAFITFAVYGGTKDVTTGFKKAGFLIIIMAILSFIENVMLLEALKIGNVIFVIPIYRTWALWAIFFGCRFMNEKHLQKRIFACGLMIFGAILILL